MPNVFDLQFVRSYEKLQLLAINEPEFDIFFSDPISEHHGNKLGYNEFDQIRYILEKNHGRYSKSFPLRIRPHPSEKVDKYVSFLNENDFSNAHVSQGTMLEDIFKADLVFGDSSYAMHLATLVGKNIVCSIPISNINSSLPHPSLRYLRDMNV